MLDLALTGLSKLLGLVIAVILGIAFLYVVTFTVGYFFLLG